MAEIVIRTKEQQQDLPPIELDEMSKQELDRQIEELGIKVAPEGEGKTEEDREELYMLLNHILSYPSTEQAETHRKANTLGKLDINKEERYHRISNRNNVWGQESFTHLCKCCGFIIQDQSLSLCSNSIENIHNLGISTFLYFKTIQNISILLGIMFVVFSIYSLATNLKAANLDIEGNYSSEILNFLSISLGSKQLYSSEEKIEMYVIGAWIGLVMLVFWAVAFVALKYYQKESEVAILMETKSVSQYSLVIEKIPTGLTHPEIQRLFKHYLQDLKLTEDIPIEDISVQKYNEGQPFFLNHQQFNNQQLNKELAMTVKYLGLFKSWIQERRWSSSFKKNDKFRQRKYKEYHRLQQRKKKVIGKITEQIKNLYKHKNQEYLTTAFVTFSTNHQKNTVLDYNPHSIISKIKNLVPCLRNPHRFVVTKEGTEFQVEISPAPDPEDILWANIGVSRSEIWGRKLVTYSITALILAISFVIAYSLSKAQVNYQHNTFISVLISLSISIINLIIGLVIELLTGYERDFTVTNYQISLHIKTVFAQLVNSIFIPIMANYFIKQNIYGENGLISDVFILGITNSLVYPLGKAINPAYLLRYFYAKYKALPCNKLDLHQFQLNQLFEKLQFQIGYEYIYIVNLWIFTCFFVSLQPILPIFAILGLLLIYWVEKYNLYHRSQRPVPGTPIINTTVSQLIYFGAVAYTLGSMTWANFIPNSQFKAALIPNLFALSASVIIFLLPYETIFRRIFKNKRMPEMSYSQNRIFFTSEYDRLNPSTSERGVSEYYQFLQNKIKELQSKDEDYKIRLSYQLQHNNRPNFYKEPQTGLMSASKYQGKNVIRNIVNKQSKNSMTPQMIATVLRKTERNHREDGGSRIKESLSLIKRQLEYKYREREEKKEDGDAEIEVEEKKERRGQGRKQKQREPSIQPEILEESQSEHQMGGLEKVQSINMGKVSGFTYNNRQSQIQHSQCQPYLPQYPQVQSFIMKAPSKDNLPNQPRQLQEKKEEGESNIPSKNEVKKRSLVKINLNQNQLFPGDSVGSVRRSFEQLQGVNAQVPNRFSLNSQLMFPMCLQSQDSYLFESQVQFYNLASFQ